MTRLEFMWPLTLTVVAPVLAQQPEPAAAVKPAPLLLVSAQPLLETKLCSVRGAAGEKGSRSDVAVIKDFIVLPDGKFEQLVLAPLNAKDLGEQLVLPMDKVRWDAGRRLLTTDYDAGQISGLARFRKSDQVLVERRPSERRAFLLSELCAASLALAKGAEGGGNDGEHDTAVAVQTIWFLPDLTHQAALVTVMAGNKPRLVPWTLLKPRCADGIVSVVCTRDAEILKTAPQFLPTAAKAQPDRMMRHEVYKHFGLPAPKWDSESAPAEATGPPK